LQVELKAKPLSDFFDAPLITYQIAGRRDNIRLPSIGMVPANNDLQPDSSDPLGNHLGEMFRGDTFLEHDEFPQKPSAQTMRTEKSERSVKKYG
jgi:hypothetical protein